MEGNEVLHSEIKFGQKIPKILQLSLDGKIFYVTKSFFSRWDNQFYPDKANTGTATLNINCGNEKRGLSIELWICCRL